MFLLRPLARYRPPLQLELHNLQPLSTTRSEIQYRLRLRSWSVCQRAELDHVGVCNERNTKVSDVHSRASVAWERRWKASPRDLGGRSRSWLLGQWAGVDDAPSADKQADRHWGCSIKRHSSFPPKGFNHGIKYLCSFVLLSSAAWSPYHWVRSTSHTCNLPQSGQTVYWTRIATWGCERWDGREVGRQQDRLCSVHNRCEA